MKAGDAAVFVDEAGLAEGIARALAERARLVPAGLERARRFGWRATAEATLRVYLEALARMAVRDDDRRDLHASASR